MVLKGRVTLNELRYGKCFALRSTKVERSFNDFDPKKKENENAAVKIVDTFWLRPKSTISEWLDLISGLCELNSNPLDFWKLECYICIPQIIIYYTHINII